MACANRVTQRPKSPRTLLGTLPPPLPPRVTFRLVVAPLRGPGQSPVLPFACCVGSLRSVGRCGRCSCWCRFRIRGAQWLVCWGCAECGMVCLLCPPPAPRPCRRLWRPERNCIAPSGPQTQSEHRTVGNRLPYGAGNTLHWGHTSGRCLEAYRSTTLYHQAPRAVLQCRDEWWRAPCKPHSLGMAECEALVGEWTPQDRVLQ